MLCAPRGSLAPYTPKRTDLRVTSATATAKSTLLGQPPIRYSDDFYSSTAVSGYNSSSVFTSIISRKALLSRGKSIILHRAPPTSFVNIQARARHFLSRFSYLIYQEATSFFGRKIIIESRCARRGRFNYKPPLSSAHVQYRNAIRDAILHSEENSCWSGTWACVGKRIRKQRTEVGVSRYDLFHFIGDPDMSRHLNRFHNTDKCEDFD